MLNKQESQNKRGGGSKIFVKCNKRGGQDKTGVGISKNSLISVMNKKRGINV